MKRGPAPGFASSSSTVFGAAVIGTGDCSEPTSDTVPSGDVTPGRTVHSTQQTCFDSSVRVEYVCVLTEASGCKQKFVPTLPCEGASTVGMEQAAALLSRALFCLLCCAVADDDDDDDDDVPLFVSALLLG